MPFFQPIAGETPITDVSELKIKGTDWPGTTLSEESAIRGEYIAAIQAADKGNYGPLQALHERFTPNEEE